MAENAYLNDTPLDVLKMVADWVAKAPTVDAVEVVHGRWEWKPQNEMLWRLQCSVCGSEDGANEEYHYCPNCGADMR